MGQGGQPAYLPRWQSNLICQKNKKHKAKSKAMLKTRRIKLKNIVLNHYLFSKKNPIKSGIHKQFQRVIKKKAQNRHQKAKPNG